jgi:hypothetical protein
MKESRIGRLRACLIGAAIGDTSGIPLEFHGFYPPVHSETLTQLADRLMDGKQ